jgi:flagellin-specific chaperone FliS
MTEKRILDLAIYGLYQRLVAAKEQNETQAVNEIVNELTELWEKWEAIQN